MYGFATFLGDCNRILRRCRVAPYHYHHVHDDIPTENQAFSSSGQPVQSVTKYKVLH